jgi:uncharacterized membrane-anchored protein
MKNKIKLILFITLCIVQLSIPAYIVLKNEITINNGIEFKFKCSPVDPYDIFRGRYVAIGVEVFDRQNIPQSDLAYLEKAGTIYALIDTDNEGFAFIKSLTSYKPQSNINYLKLYVNKYKYINNPFTKFFMNQEKAPKAEKIYRDNLWEKDAKTYITVKIKNGKGTITGLYIDDKSIYELIK